MVEVSTRTHADFEILIWRTTLAAVAVLALFRLYHVAINEDVTFLVIAADRLMSGGRFGSDVLEINTPVAILIYLPAALVHRIFGWRIDHIVPGMMIIMLILLILLAERILVRVWADQEEGREASSLLSTIWLFALTLPAYQFGQRDHLIVGMILPYLAATLAAQHDRPVGRSLEIAAGGLMALALAVKPHYSLLLPVLWWPRLAHGRWRHWLKATDVRAVILTGILLAAGSLLLFPQWIDVARLAIRYYDGLSVPYSELLSDLMRYDAAGVGAGLIALLAWRFGRGCPPTLHAYCGVLLRISPILLFTFLIQKKGFAYHLIPFDSVNLVAAAAVCYGLFMRLKLVRLITAGSLVLLMGLALWNIASRKLSSDEFANDPVIRTIAANDRGGGVAFLATGMMPAIQATVLMDTQWAMRGPSLWMLLGLKRQLQESGIPLNALDAFEPSSRRLVADAKWYRRAIIDDLIRYRPDVVLILLEDRGPLSRPPLEVLKFLSGDAQFSEVWSQFIDGGTLETNQGVYRLMIRKESN